MFLGGVYDRHAGGPLEFLACPSYYRKKRASGTKEMAGHADGETPMAFHQSKRQRGVRDKRRGARMEPTRG